jgi:hypothetical protein
MPGLDVGELVSGDPAGRAHPCNATLLARQTACGEATESFRLRAWVRQRRWALANPESPGAEWLIGKWTSGAELHNPATWR